MSSATTFYVHESSFVDQPCEIGKNTKIWHFSHIMKDSLIGEGCNIGQNVVISSGCRLGDNVKIQNNVSVYTGVILEDDVFCGPSMVFTNVINPRSHIPRKDEYKTTRVKQGASIGANATVVCGTTLGRYCFVGAGSVITKDVPDYAMVVRQSGSTCAGGCATVAKSCDFSSPQRPMQRRRAPLAAAATAVERTRKSRNSIQGNKSHDRQT